MTVIDIFVLFLLGGGAIFGFARGFVQETLSIIAWICVIIAVRFFHTSVSEYLAVPIGTESGAAVVAFLGLGIITYFFGKQIAKYAGSKSRKSILGPIDRVLGFGFGAMKGLIIATLLFLFLILSMETIFGSNEKPEWLTESRTYPLLNASGNALSTFVEQRRISDTQIEEQDAQYSAD